MKKNFMFWTFAEYFRADVNIRGVFTLRFVDDRRNRETAFEAPLESCAESRGWH